MLNLTGRRKSAEAEATCVRGGILPTFQTAPSYHEKPLYLHIPTIILSLRDNSVTDRQTDQ